MGWYITYELEFERSVDWDAEFVKHTLRDINHFILYLHDFETERAVLNLYSQESIQEVLQLLYNLYRVPIRYRRYQTDSWSPFKESL